MELYFSNKQVSPDDSSNTVNLSLIEENNTISQLKSSKQVNLNTSKGSEAYETSRNNITGKQIVNFIP